LKINKSKQVKESLYINRLFQKLISSNFFIFPIKGKLNATDNHGVYIIYTPEDLVVHVGSTPSGKKGLNQRLYNHISCTGMLYHNYLKVLNIEMRGTHKFKFLIVSDPRKRALLESFTAGILCPIYFGTSQKK